jgi:hypothetical protein
MATPSLHSLVVTIGTALACVVSATSPASAAQTSSGGYVTQYTEGAQADCALSVDNDLGYGHLYGYLMCNSLIDTEADGNAVYVAWDSPDSYAGWRSIYQRNGYGAEPRRIVESRYIEGAHRLKWKVCRDRQVPWPDNCSSDYTAYFS